MKIFLDLPILIASFLLTFHLSAKAETPLDTKMGFVCHNLLNGSEFNYPANFSQSFRDKVPKEYMQSALSEIMESMGTCKDYKLFDSMPLNGRYRITSNVGNEATILLVLNEAHLIEGLMIQDLDLKDIKIATWSDAVGKLAQLPGHSAVYYQQWDSSGRSVLTHTLHSEEFQPVGSGFKLYVLGALADNVSAGKNRWEEIYPINPEWKSIPSGIMHTWENGKQVSLLEYATYMIEISDNTATDHLIKILGRNRIEEQTSIMKNDFVVLNSPFLLTSEMFKIKWAAPKDLITQYANGSEHQRRTLLENEIESLKLTDIGTNGVDRLQPAYIRNIEWFASPRNLCDAMMYLKETHLPEVLSILSRNTPFVKINQKSKIQYAGFKGGSEPGVITMTYLFQMENKDWSCLSVAWNNEVKAINQTIFQDIVRKTISLINPEVPPESFPVNKWKPMLINSIQKN